MPYADADTIIQAPPTHTLHAVSDPPSPGTPWKAINVAAWLVVAILTFVLIGVVAVDLMILHL